VVEENGNAPIGVKAEEPILLLLVGHDVAGICQGIEDTDRRKGGGNVHESCSPFCTVDFVELFEHDLYLLAIGRVLGDEVKTLGDHC